MPEMNDALVCFEGHSVRKQHYLPLSMAGCFGTTAAMVLSSSPLRKKKKEEEERENLMKEKETERSLPVDRIFPGVTFFQEANRLLEREIGK